MNRDAQGRFTDGNRPRDPKTGRFMPQSRKTVDELLRIGISDNLGCLPPGTITTSDKGYVKADFSHIYAPEDTEHGGMGEFSAAPLSDVSIHHKWLRCPPWGQLPDLPQGYQFSLRDGKPIRRVDLVLVDKIPDPLTLWQRILRFFRISRRDTPGRFGQF